jgi:polyphosphate kinase
VMFTFIGESVTMVQSEYFTDRELSWLSFNERVLELAEDSSNPLLERMRYLAIFASNLDEFFMVRVATLKSKIESGSKVRNSAGFTPQELMEKILRETRALNKRQSKCLHEELLPNLAMAGISLVKWEELEEEECRHVTALFNARIFPVLTPLAVDPSRPFPYISGLSLNLAVIVKNSVTKEEFFARVKVPPILSRFVGTGSLGNKRFIPLEELIAANLSDLFPGMEIEDHYTFRVTRNQDLELDEEETDDLLSTLEQELLRRRFGPPVRLEIEAGIGSAQLKRLADELGIDEDEIISSANPLDLTGLNQLVALDLPSLKFPPLKSRTAPGLVSVNTEECDSFFSAMRQGEILLHHPYESFTNSVVQFLQNAAEDPTVLAIKQTLYRTSGDSPIVDALIEAAEAGKQVLAVIEIRARFDEQANVRWARKLEASGAHVVYGLMGFKTHAKLSLVVRDEPDGLRRYCHIGTGNYNPKTARTYEDIGLLSADAVLTEDLTKLFNQLSGFAPQSEYSRLLVAPRTLRQELLAKIDREIQNQKLGLTSGIQFKLNSLLDEEFVEALYQASEQGVPVELLIRGICSLRSGIPRLSDKIKVRSILGRFLEHSRIFHFVNGGADEYWIGSADLMHRNLDRRVESLVRIDRELHKRQLQYILDFGMSDQVASWHLDGTTWNRVTLNSEKEKLVDFQVAMMNYYQKDK